jgi:hypothetical protein
MMHDPTTGYSRQYATRGHGRVDISAVVKKRRVAKAETLPGLRRK